MNMILSLAFLVQADPSAVARAEGGLNTFAFFFMVISMISVTSLMVWCYYRILSDQKHFDPDGTGPAHSPVRHEVDD